LTSLEVWDALAAAGRSGVSVALCTVTGVDGSAPRAAGARMIVYADGSILGTVGGGQFEHRVRREAAEVLRSGRPRRFAVHLTRDLGMCCGGAMEAYIEPVEPPPQLVCFGAGHIVGALAPLARGAGFRVTVVDSREDWNTEARFPGCGRVEQDPRAWARSMPTGAHTWALVCTHDHMLDQDLVEILLPRAGAWLGLVGSRSKAAKFFLRLRAGGMEEALFARLRVPAGLDIGAETPGEIAVSIVAELVALRRGHEGPVLPLSERPLPARGGDGRATRRTDVLPDTSS
jgi:xanthine dehydrogenase accessory factor